MIQVNFKLQIGVGVTFTRTVGVEVIPTKMLKVLNHSFIVREHEQDLDAYMLGQQQKGLFCNSVKATINNEEHPADSYEEIREIFRESGWKEHVKEY